MSSHHVWYGLGLGWRPQATTWSVVHLVRRTCCDGLDQHHPPVNTKDVPSVRRHWSTERVCSCFAALKRAHVLSPGATRTQSKGARTMSWRPHPSLLDGKGVGTGIVHERAQQLPIPTAMWKGRKPSAVQFEPCVHAPRASATCCGANAGKGTVSSCACHPWYRAGGW